eukprot:TRINITY_DN12812_c0_g1_i1.p1 TRINITY_DN12812_c0_g1~~TRINITY_DN12812_c0_g1_i1.p1  ORF type:complete len:208 (-),score=35.39 TRINITY_DN12812_c0_g1_i1:43-624(-)
MSQESNKRSSDAVTSADCDSKACDDRSAKKAAVSYLPEGYGNVTPYITASSAIKVIEFCIAAFDAKEEDRMTRPDGKIAHTALAIGNSKIMLSDTWHSDSEVALAQLYVYVPDVDATYKKALAAGATSTFEPRDMFYGDRHCSVKDAVGNTWWISTRIEDVSATELRERSAKMFAEMKQGDQKDAAPVSETTA